MQERDSDPESSRYYTEEHDTKDADSVLTAMAQTISRQDKKGICKREEELTSITMPDGLRRPVDCFWCKPGSKTSDVAQQTEEINNAKEQCLQ